MTTLLFKLFVLSPQRFKSPAFAIPTLDFLRLISFFRGSHPSLGDSLSSMLRRTSRFALSYCGIGSSEGDDILYLAAQQNQIGPILSCINFEANSCSTTSRGIGS
jgi:hypothetical protein